MDKSDSAQGQVSWILFLQNANQQFESSFIVIIFAIHPTK